MIHKNIKALLTLSFLTLILSGLIHFYIILFLPPSPDGRWKEVVISKGMSFKEITMLLKREGIIKKEYTFHLLGGLLGITRKIRAGYYSLSPAIPMVEIIEILKKGRIIEFTITIPEGATIGDIAEILKRKGLTTQDSFISLAHDPEFINSMGIKAPSLEGYLFPDTYLLPKGITAPEIAERMVGRFIEVITPEILDRANKLGLTINEIITLASIIEREAQIDSERPLISAVYHNRLRKGMFLQADPTAIYGRKRLDERITKKDLQSKSPYNTYRIRGLPPGPIANPGLKSIKAALYPADVDYLFFVSKNDETHHFSTTDSEHSEAVIKYQRERQEGG